MKKIILMAVIATYAVSAVKAQEFKKGDWVANVGISISDTDPLHFGGSIEYGLVGNVFNVNGLTLGLGAELGYSHQSLKGGNISLLVAGVRVPFHYSPVEKLDLYTAPTLLIAVTSYSGNSKSTTEFGWVLVGARYYFTPNIGVFAELGHNNALGGAVGISFKF